MDRLEPVGQDLPGRPMPSEKMPYRPETKRGTLETKNLNEETTNETEKEIP